MCIYLIALWLGIGLTTCVFKRFRIKDETGLTVPSPFHAGMDDSTFSCLAQQEMEDLRILFTGLNKVIVFAEKRPHLFKPVEEGVLLPDVKDTIRQIWKSYLDYMVALEQTRLRHTVFWKINYFKHRAANLESFSLTFGALLAMYMGGSHMIRLVEGKSLHMVFLDEASLDIPPDSYSRIRFHVTNYATFLILCSYFVHYKEWCIDYFKKRGEDTFTWMSGFQEIYYDSILNYGKSQNFKVAKDVTIDATKKQTFMLWFPVQKNLAKWMGTSRYSKKRNPLISQAQIDSLSKLLEPGDIIFERANFQLSNIGLPGFWPHAALYIGDEKKIAAFFQDDSALANHLSLLNNSKPVTLVQFLKETYPDKYRQFAGPNQTDGHIIQTIEGLANGIVFNSLQATCHADYIAAVRPKLTKKEKGIAIINAFAFQGTPYDFDFDFATDATLVCTELVFKAYQARKNLTQGLIFNLTEVLGRLTLPPNHMVAQFDTDYNSPERQMEFVAFLDGSESKGSAAFKDLAAFRKSHLRSKWDIFY
jgi:hypothetical protein